MRRYTTPTQTLVIDGTDITGADEITVTYRQYLALGSVNSRRVDVTGLSAVLDEDGNSVIQVPLSQMQTGSFKPGVVEVQVNYLYEDEGLRGATTTARFQMGENLLPEVMGNE